MCIAWLNIVQVLITADDTKIEVIEASEQQLGVLSKASLPKGKARKVTGLRGDFSMTAGLSELNQARSAVWILL